MKKEFKQVNTPKLMDEFISNNIKVIKADVFEDSDISVFEFEEEQDIELIEKIASEHNSEIVEQLTNEERMTQIENAILELAALLGGE